MFSGFSFDPLATRVQGITELTIALRICWLVEEVELKFNLTHNLVELDLHVPESGVNFLKSWTYHFGLNLNNSVFSK